MNSKMTTNITINNQTWEKQKQNELSKQLEQEKIHRNRDHLKGYPQGGGGGEWGKTHRE